jgi:HK97 family phage major capsid protein
MTITQYQEAIKHLMDKVAGIKTRCAAENGREPTEAETALKNELLDEVEDLQKKLATEEREERMREKLEAPTAPPATKPRPHGTIEVGDNNRSKDRFSSLGEQLMSVRNAAISGSIDPRLYRAATGMSEVVPSDGGFLVQTDFSNELLQQLNQTDVLAARCRRMTVSGASNSIKINGVDETSRATTRFGGIVGYWKDEAASKTASAPTFRKIELNLKKLIGLCYATDELLADATALEGFIRQAFASEFGFKRDDAIINGTGAGQPLGILNAGCTVSVAKETGQTTKTIVAENIIKMYSRIFAGSLGNAVWLVNQDTLPQLYTMSLAVGTGGAPIFMPAGGLSQSPYNTILGRPVLPIEQCATLGTVGDIIFADLGGYILAEKGGLQSDMSIHVKFDTDESVFRFVMRLDGQPERSTPLTPYKGSNTLSHFITLATR